MKDLKISKELLGEVLGYEVDAFLGISENEIDYTCCKDKDIGYEDISINIYEFAFKCKEWAKSKDYYILSGYDDTNIPVSLINHHYGEGGCSCDKYFETNTEPEAVFKACQWILEQRINPCTE